MIITVGHRPKTVQYLEYSLGYQALFPPAPRKRKERLGSRLRHGVILGRLIRPETLLILLLRVVYCQKDDVAKEIKTCARYGQS